MPCFLECLVRNSIKSSVRFSSKYGTAFGFLPGKEVKDAGVGNLGLHDRAYLDFSICIPSLTLVPAQNDSHSGGLTSTSLSLGVIPAR